MILSIYSVSLKKHSNPWFRETFGAFLDLNLRHFPLLHRKYDKYISNNSEKPPLTPTHTEEVTDSEEIFLRIFSLRAEN